MIIVDPAKNTVDQPEGRKTLILLVRRSKVVRAFPDLYADFITRLDAAIVAVDQTDALALNAVLAQLLLLPQFVADSEGSDTRRTFFSVGGNWEELANTAIDVLYEPYGDMSGAMFGSVTRGMPPGCDPYDYNIIWLDERRWR
jgi:hypothetical protein